MDLALPGSLSMGFPERALSVATFQVIFQPRDRICILAWQGDLEPLVEAPSTFYCDPNLLEPDLPLTSYCFFLAATYRASLLKHMLHSGSQLKAQRWHFTVLLLLTRQQESFSFFHRVGNYSDLAWSKNVPKNKGCRRLVRLTFKVSNYSLRRVYNVN